MVFNSLFFFITLVVFMIFYLTRNDKRSSGTKIATLIYSYFFYGMWNPGFLILLLISTLVDYFAARGIDSKPHHKKIYLTLSLLTNLGLLGFFKYFNFFMDTVAGLLGILGVVWAPSLLQIALPVGISFYTFQTLSYTIDVYRGEISAKKNFLDIALYVAFFPQLVAGPIVRARDFLPQLSRKAFLIKENMADGICLILAGLFLKVVLADNVAPRVNFLFANWKFNGILENWAGAMLFGIQIYGDFSGYSLIAIGIAKIMGFDIFRNFNAPYTAVGFSDFWRRWHISLSTWLRDYLYIPLGGNRKGQGRTYLNLMVTMLLGGLWHGASLLFVAWGALHGVFLCIERIFMNRFQQIQIENAWLKRAVTVAVVCFTYVMVSAAWIPFRAISAEQGFRMLAGLFFGKLGFYDGFKMDYLIILVVFLFHSLTRKREVFMKFKTNGPLRFGVVGGGLLSLLYFSGERSDFIYFQF